MFFVKRECIRCAAAYHLQKEMFLFCAVLAFFNYSSIRTHPFNQSALRFAVGEAFRRRHVSSVLLQETHLCLSLTKGAIASLSDRSASARRDDLEATTTSCMLDRLPLLNPLENTDRCGEQLPDASPVNIGRPLDIVFYT